MNNYFYSDFSIFFTNQEENLKKILMLLNHESEKIKTEALNILKYFFENVESKSDKIKLIIKGNKAKFEEYFIKNKTLIEKDEDLQLVQSFILYELEKMENY